MIRTTMILASLLCLAVAGTTGLMLDRQRAALPGGTEELLRRSGAVRIFCLDALWMEMNAHLSQGNEGLVLSTARTLLELDPQSDRARCFLFRHLAFTMARKAVTEDESALWISEGFSIMEEALQRDPDAPWIHRELGLALFTRTEYPDAAFSRVCLARTGGAPAEQAPKHLETAWTGLGDEETGLFFTASLLNAARFAMERERYTQAAQYWGQALERMAPWLEGVEDPDERDELLAHYQDLETYCLLMADLKKGKDSGRIDVKKIETLKQRIDESRFYLPQDETE